MVQKSLKTPLRNIKMAPNGILGVKEENALATYTGDGNMVGAVKIVEQYKTVNSSYELTVQGKHNLVEVLRMQVSI